MFFTQTKLPNNIRVILAPQRSTQAVSVLVLVKVGSRYEAGDNSGVSHFVEHLLFKGTAKRPNTQIIAQELDAIGADYNAFTGKDKTGYYIKAEKSHLPLLVDMLHDMTANPLFAAEEIERERGTILEEINMYEDNPMAQIENLFEEDLFGRQTPLGRHIIGTPRTIRSIARKQIQDYWHHHYHAQNIVIAVAGNISAKRANQLLAASFGSIARGRKNTVQKQRPAFAKKRFNAHPKDTNQAHVMIGFEGVAYEHADKYPVALLATILGGNMSSRLFISVRERLGLCYFIRAAAETFEDTGTFVIQAGLDKRNLDRALVAMSREIKDIKRNGPKRDELVKAQTYLKGKMALSQEDSMDVASFYAGQALVRRQLKTPEQVYRNIDKVTRADVARVAKKLLRPKKAYLTAISPHARVSQFAQYLDF